MSEGFLLSLADIARALGVTLPPVEMNVTGVSTDTRTLVPGDLFIAIQGEKFDAQRFVADAAAKGARAAVVTATVAGVAIPQLVVADTRKALGLVARLWRSRFSAPTLALTGSNGKTTVKEMLRAILGVSLGDPAAVHVTDGNLNNDIGVPLMMLRQRAHHRAVVFEMGMNHLGEIDYLSRLVEPDVAMVIMAGTAHIGELGSREKIAEAKGEIYRGLKPGGTAVVNLHDRFGAYWCEQAKAYRTIGFGILPEDDVVGSFGDTLRIAHAGQSVEVRLAIPGAHNQRNALAAATGALALGATLVQVREGLEKFAGVAGRLKRFAGHNSATIIDDTYNANPDSAKAAIQVLRSFVPPRILVMGDMGELGVDAPALHREVGAYAREAGIEELFSLGPNAKETAGGFGRHGTPFDSHAALVAALKPKAARGTTVLVKGSRFMQMERVVAELVPDYHGHH